MAPLRFGDCVFDAEGREVRRAGRRLELSPQALELLAALLSRRPAAVAKETLRDLLWPRTYVGPTSLPRLVNELRRALGEDTASPRFIRTVHRFGYAFDGPAVPLAAKDSSSPGAASLHSNGREFPLLEGENLIGRSGDCVVRIASPRVSRHHARIVVADGVATLEDLGSKNGTFVGTSRLEHPIVLCDGNQIRVGTTVLVFMVASDGGRTETGSIERLPS
jgi:DNA-binding winged helix-turn-helix (wHTH) protein